MHKLCHYDESVMDYHAPVCVCVCFSVQQTFSCSSTLSLSHMQPCFVDFKETVDNTTILGERLMKSSYEYVRGVVWSSDLAAVSTTATKLGDWVKGKSPTGNCPGWSRACFLFPCFIKTM